MEKKDLPSFCLHCPQKLHKNIFKSLILTHMWTQRLPPLKPGNESAPPLASLINVSLHSPLQEAQYTLWSSYLWYSPKNRLPDKMHLKELTESIFKTLYTSFCFFILLRTLLAYIYVTINCNFKIQILCIKFKLL